MKPCKYSKEILEAKDVFEENACDHTVPWESALNSFHNYIDVLRVAYPSSGSSSKELYTAFEIDRCALILKQKHLDPKSLGTSFAIWKRNYRP
tara:strand:- start:475 stop:753 length:279 start_codon:yes stop_codon:yes gene_type:complete